MRCLAVGVGGGSVGDYIDDVEPTSVVTIDNGGRLDATIWGDILNGRGPSTQHRGYSH
jgi:4-hydroxy-4-methyl-2-oxoglutarate aldolase